MVFTLRYELNLNIADLYKIHIAQCASSADLPKVNLNFFAKTHPLELDGGFIMMWASKYKIQPKSSLYSLCCKIPIAYFPFFLPSSRNSFSLLPVYLYRKDERVLSLYPQSSNIFWSPHFPLSILHLTALHSILLYFSLTLFLVFTVLIGNVLWSLGFDSYMSVCRRVLYCSILAMSQINVQIFVKK
jgi:hypothetical protein